MESRDRNRCCLSSLQVMMVVVPDDGSGGNSDPDHVAGYGQKRHHGGSSLEQFRNITNIVTLLDGTIECLLGNSNGQSIPTGPGTSGRLFSDAATWVCKPKVTFGRFKPDVVAPGIFRGFNPSQPSGDQGAYYNPTNFHSQTILLNQEVTSNTSDSWFNLGAAKCRGRCRFNFFQILNSPVPLSDQHADLRFVIRHPRIRPILPPTIL